eukprot:TRINITY_DN3090_c0_g1_i2.p1 TRINITY_DN3090_c0_g1~~TRINITY_DN3090_c0_g1_i2.p1  ORF type:complete len:855 (-),score=104.21 TRINITY_DN3090_c0_g1_i2:566-3130(-)
MVHNDDFRELLRQVAEAHEKEIAELRRMLTEAQLSAAPSGPSLCGVDHLAIANQEAVPQSPPGSVKSLRSSHDKKTSSKDDNMPRNLSREPSPSKAGLVRSWTLHDNELKSIRRSTIPSRFVIRPESRLRITMDLLSLLFAGFDVVYIPLWFCFFDESVGVSVFAIVSGIIVSMFWSTDIALSFCSAHPDKHGYINTDARHIARAYLCGWFVIDVLTVLCDWMAMGMFLMESSLGSGLQALRAAKVHRFMRIVRFISIFRCLKRLTILWNFIVSFDTQFMFTQVFKYFGMILVMNHFVACIWYEIGKIEHGWVLAFEEKEGGQDLTLRYFTSLHWAISQMTPGSMEVFPKTLAERIFNVIVLIFGLLIGSSLVSLLSSKMVQLQMGGQAQIQQELILKKYMIENRVSARVSTEALKHFHARKKQKALLESHVVALKELPDLLMAEVQSEAFSHHLDKHPLFFSFDKIARRCLIESARGLVFKDLYVKAIKSMSLAEGEDLFHSGTEGNEAYVLTNGSVSYVETSSGLQTCLFGACLATGDPLPWLSEPSLWSSNWIRSGTAKGLSNCKVLTISKSHLADALSKDPRAKLLYSAHAIAFTRRAEKFGCSDLLTVFDRWSILVDMDPDSRLEMGEHALNYMRGKTSWISNTFGFGMTFFDSLQDDVANRKVTVSVGVDGYLERNVMIALMELTRPDERVFVQFAQTRDGHESSSTVFYLPGAKVKVGENPIDAMRRTFSSRLHDMFDFSILQSARVEHVVEMASSPKGVQTRYLKTVFSTSIDENGVTTTDTMFGRVDHRIRALQHAMKQLGCEDNFQDCDPVFLTDSESNSQMLFCWLQIEHYQRQKSQRRTIQA